MTYYQWTSGHIVATFCAPFSCGAFKHGRFSAPKKVYWAWDRSLGAWVHYAVRKAS